MHLLEQIQALRFPAPLPARLLEVRQVYEYPRVADVAGAARAALEASGLLGIVQPGESVAVGVGSRGIANLPAIVRAVVDRLKAHGARPFIVAAMGSHGGATAEGQRALLAELGITEASMGCPLRITMEVREIGRLPDGPALYQDLDSAAADHTLLISRIKPHTDFRGSLESGPTKMAVIGLGKRIGAEAMHAWGTAGFQQFLAPAARLYQTNTNLRGAIAILENGYDETAEIVGLTADQIGTEVEAALLRKARALMLGLPFKQIDVLVIRELGKDISGAGMDTNVLGRLRVNRQPEPEDASDIGALVLLDLTEATHGNASGIGLADVITARALRKADFATTYTNAITATTFGLKRSFIPIVMADDRRALEVAVRCCGAHPGQAPTFVFARNTLALSQLWMSENLRPQIAAHPHLRIAGEAPLTFDEDGRMTSPWCLGPG
jgi:hypothetical protein